MDFVLCFEGKFCGCECPLLYFLHSRISSDSKYKSVWSEDNLVIECVTVNCSVTMPEGVIPGTEHLYDVLLFDVGDLRLFNSSTNMLNLPKRRNENQLYIMYTLNRPANYSENSLLGKYK